MLVSSPHTTTATDGSSVNSANANGSRVLSAGSWDAFISQGFHVRVGWSGRTVPPTNVIPSSLSSSSNPLIPMTYAFLSFGSFMTDEM